MGIVSESKKFFSHSLLMRYAKRLEISDIHTKIDTDTGLLAIISIHSNELGPAIGGCRFHTYASHGHALLDAMRLSYMMTLKAAISGLHHGGAKSVIMAPSHPYNRQSLFHAFGDFVHSLNGRYITACDVGTKTTDMDTICERTPYVIGATKTHAAETTPSIHTAKGVYLGMQAALEHRYDSDNFHDKHISIQGAGSVAYYLAEYLLNAGATVTVCDTNPDAITHITKHLGVNVCNPNDIYDIPSDIFAPCALGGTVNFDTIKRIQAPIIAGSANNQLSHSRIASILKKQNRLYAPDFVINSGGLINAAIVYDYTDPDKADLKIDQLKKTIKHLFELSELKNQNTQDVAIEIAMQKIELAKEKNTNPLINQQLDKTL